MIKFGGFMIKLPGYALAYLILTFVSLQMQTEANDWQQVGIAGIILTAIGFGIEGPVRTMLVVLGFAITTGAALGWYQPMPLK